MDREVIAQLCSKFNSYEIFGNFIPGATFCLLNQELGLCQIKEKNPFIRLLIFYLVGIFVGRTGEIFIKKVLGMDKGKAEYVNYVEASSENTFIRVLHETSICYQSMVGVFLCEMLLSLIEIINNCEMGFVFMFAFGSIILFVLAYKEQEKSVQNRVNIYIKRKIRDKWNCEI